MLRTIEAVIEPDGRVRLLEPVELTATHRALVTVLDDAGPRVGVAPLDDEMLVDWSRGEEEPGSPSRVTGVSPVRGMSGEEMLRFAGAISPEDLDVMERVIQEEFERIDPHGW